MSLFLEIVSESTSVATTLTQTTREKSNLFLFCFDIFPEQSNSPTFAESWREVTTQESFPYNPGLPSVRDKEGRKEEGEPGRKGRKERQEKQEKWNSWSSSSGEI